MDNDDTKPDPKPIASYTPYEGVTVGGTTLYTSDPPEQVAATLGATLEAPAAPAQPAPAAPPEPAPEAEPDEAPAPAAAAPEKTPDEPRPKGKDTPEKRIAQAQWERRQSQKREREALERADAAERELAALKSALPPPKPAAAPAAEKFPSWEAWAAQPENDGKDYDDYQDARSDWRLAKRGFISREEAERLAVEKAKELAADERRAADEAQARKDDDTRRSALLTSVEEAKTKYPDYLEVVEKNDELGFENETAAEAIRRAGPMAGELLYYFGTHPQEVQRINDLRTPAEVIEEMALIKIRLKGAPSGPSLSATSVTRAPAPIEPVGSARSTPSLSLANPNLSFADFEKIRDEQERAAAGRW